METKHTSDTTTSLIEQKETKILMNAEICIAFAIQQWVPHDPTQNNILIIMESHGTTGKS